MMKSTTSMQSCKRELTTRLAISLLAVSFVAFTYGCKSVEIDGQTSGLKDAPDAAEMTHAKISYTTVLRAIDDIKAKGLDGLGTDYGLTYTGNSVDDAWLLFTFGDSKQQDAFTSTILKTREDLFRNIQGVWYHQLKNEGSCDDLIKIEWTAVIAN